jgi:Protein of unknown function (DUF1153)
LPLTLADLPSPQTERWVARRKAQVVTAVRGGLLNADDVCYRYALTFDEFLAWERAFARFDLSPELLRVSPSSRHERREQN